MSNYALGLDVGERRVGVALASLIARLPAPLTTIDRQKVTNVFAEIYGLAEQHNASVIVMGLPRGMSGQDTAQTTRVREFADKLATNLTIPVVMQDEAVTSLEAEQLLKARRKPYDKADIDAEAAVIILRDYLSQQAEQTV